MRSRRHLPGSAAPRARRARADAHGSTGGAPSRRWCSSMSSCWPSKPSFKMVGARDRLESQRRAFHPVHIVARRIQPAHHGAGLLLLALLLLLFVVRIDDGHCSDNDRDRDDADDDCRPDTVLLAPRTARAMDECRPQLAPTHRVGLEDVLLRVRSASHGRWRRRHGALGAVLGTHWRPPEIARAAPTRSIAMRVDGRTAAGSKPRPVINTSSGGTTTTRIGSIARRRTVSRWTWRYDSSFWHTTTYTALSTANGSVWASLAVATSSAARPARPAEATTTVWSLRATAACPTSLASLPTSSRANV